MTRLLLSLAVLLCSQVLKAEVVAKPNYPEILAPLINHQKLDTLKGKRAATPRLRKGKYQTPTEEPLP